MARGDGGRRALGGSGSGEQALGRGLPGLAGDDVALAGGAHDAWRRRLASVGRRRVGGAGGVGAGDGAGRQAGSAPATQGQGAGGRRAGGGRRWRLGAWDWSCGGRGFTHL
ncbi:spidroin-1-like [Panicum virgatum]|uniref:spidroin-1-like n=1 Tax=Panicum virgatum TaxID=38727 RepID=UPI0019D61AC2|nr:spidroin-1-like [Panicum virgatum]